MSDKIYDATKKYCGAIAVSWYEPFVDALRVIEQCHIRGIKVNIHYLLHRENIRAAANLLRSRADWLDQVNAVIFLNYKPIHSQQSLCLEDNEDLDAFLSAVHEHKGYKLGFDSCMVSYLVKFDDSLSYETLEFCEAGRFSAFISEKGLMYPCSFLHDTDCSGIDLTQSSLEQGWQYGIV